MWVSDRWTDYELIDCGRGEAGALGGAASGAAGPAGDLGEPRTHPGWKRAGGRCLRSSSGGGHWEKKALPERWTVRYGELTFQVKPMNFKHTGVFPEQAANWDFA